MKLTYKCPLCQKALVLEKEFKLGPTTLYAYKCGHIFAKTLHQLDKSTLDLDSVDGQKHARNYQADGVEFILNSGYNCIIADQMRLGKTPQSLLALKNAMGPDSPGGSKLPALIIVKSANLWQWIREFKTWVTELPNGIFPIQGGSAFVFPGFSAYIISMDTFGLNASCTCGHRFHEKACKGKNCTCKSYVSTETSVRDQLKKIPFKLIIVDEAHSFKNTDSNRSQALVDFVRFMNTGEEATKLDFTCVRCEKKWTEEGKVKFDKRIGHVTVSKSSRCPQCGQYAYQQQQHSETDAEKKQEPCGLILLTGTPIMNRAEEYFVPLNLIAPEKFSSLEQFRRQWLAQDSKGRYSRVKHYCLEAFKETIKPYMLRREWNDVYTDLPALNKMYELIEPDKGSVSERYNQILDNIEAKFANKVDLNYWDTASEMMELRQICGLMKLPWVVDYLQGAEIVDGPQKWAIGIHHESVRDILFLQLGGAEKCVRFSGAENAEQKIQIMDNFATSKQQYLIINMVAGGVGCDFHYVNNIITLERMWNSAMEDQFEARFYNPDKSIKKDPTNVLCPVAKGTLDEFGWFDMIEEKRKTFGETVANSWDLQNDTASFRELVNRTLASRI